MKFLHLSDLHFHRRDKDNRETTKALEFVAQKYPDHYLVVTGDITDDGHEEQYFQAYDALQQFVPKVFVSPGNHDFGFAGNFYKRRLAKRFDQLIATELQQNGKFAGFNKPVVNVVEEDDTKVVIVSLDSNRETWWFGDWACGRVGYWQRRHLKSILETHTDYVRIVCFHHHPFTRKRCLKMTDADKVRDALNGQAEVVMFGHRHRQERWEDKDGVPYFLAAGELAEEEDAWEVTIEGRDISVQPVAIA